MTGESDLPPDPASDPQLAPPSGYKKQRSCLDLKPHSAGRQETAATRSLGHSAVRLSWNAPAELVDAC